MITKLLSCEEKESIYWKDDGTYHSHRVAKGFSHVPGKVIQEHHAPVVHDTTFCVVLILKLIYKPSSYQFDIAYPSYIFYWMRSIDNVQYISYVLNRTATQYSPVHSSTSSSHSSSLLCKSRTSKEPLEPRAR
jgi:hypothetical protein